MQNKELKVNVTGLLQDLMDLAEEIDWSDDRLLDYFEEDLRSNISKLAITMYAINGYQCWNTKD